MPVIPHYCVVKGELQMRNVLKKYGCLLFVIIVSLFLISCGKKEATVSEITFPASEDLGVGVPDLDNFPMPKNQNLLTGICDLTKEAIGKRPVAVMINNVPAALPQYGISKADVIFELPVEGDLTRLMALYADYTQMPDICAIRSCRYYYPAIAKGFDAFYVHWGMDMSVLGYVNGLGIDRYDGMANTGGLYGRDAARRKAGYSLEHTGYFKGTQFASAVKKAGQRTSLLDSKKDTAFKFSKLGTVVTPDGKACSNIHVKFGNASATLDYDTKTNTYYKKINGKAHVDGKTGEQLSFTNVFVLETSISIRDSVGHKKLDWAGSSQSKGYYISNGMVQDIYWSKANGDESSYLCFYDAQGNELEINRGKSYIAYTYAGKTTFN